MRVVVAAPSSFAVAQAAAGNFGVVRWRFVVADNPPAADGLVAAGDPVVPGDLVIAGDLVAEADPVVGNPVAGHPVAADNSGAAGNLGGVAAGNSGAVAVAGKYIHHLAVWHRNHTQHICQDQRRHHCCSCSYYSTHH